MTLTYSVSRFLKKNIGNIALPFFFLLKLIPSMSWVANGASWESRTPLISSKKCSPNDTMLNYNGICWHLALQCRTHPRIFCVSVWCWHLRCRVTEPHNLPRIFCGGDKRQAVWGAQWRRGQDGIQEQGVHVRNKFQKLEAQPAIKPKTWLNLNFSTLNKGLLELNFEQSLIWIWYYCTIIIGYFFYV